MGNINRPPHISMERSNCLKISRNIDTAHCTILLEAGGLERHSDLFQRYNKMCLVAMPDGHAHPIACVCSSDDITSRIELLRRIQLDSDRLKWLAHAATFRIIWGEVAEDTHGGITAMQRCPHLSSPSA